MIRRYQNNRLSRAIENMRKATQKMQTQLIEARWSRGCRVFMAKLGRKESSQIICAILRTKYQCGFKEPRFSVELIVTSMDIGRETAKRMPENSSARKYNTVIISMHKRPSIQLTGVT